jgi:hypothetical protein
MDAEEILVVPDVQLVGGIEKALAEREIIDGIQHIRLPCPVESDKTVHLLRERHFGGLAVLEVSQSQLFQVHRNAV